MFACEHEGVVPDLITTAKGIAGGLPLAAVTGRAELMDAVHGGGLGGTYGGNPAACAAALASLEAIESDDLVGRAREIGALMLDRLRTLADKYEVIGDVRGRGAMVAIELVKDGKEPATEALAQVVAHCHSRGLILLSAGTYGNVIRMLPPLAISDDLLREGLDEAGEGLAGL